MTTTLTPPPVPAPVAPRRGTSPWLVVGAIVGALMVLQSGVSAGALLVSRLDSHSDTQAIDLPAAPRLVVSLGSGSVTITGTDTDRIGGTAARNWSYVEPQVETSREGDAARIGVDCTWSFTGYCTVDIELSVPEGTVVDLRSSSGDLTVAGLRAGATLSADSGRVSATDVVGDVSAESDSGDIRLGGVTGNVVARAESGRIEVTDTAAQHVEARSESGDIRIELTDDPQSVDARASSGSIAIRVPDTARVAYALDLRTSSGETATGVRTDPSSSRTIRAHTSSGDVEVTY